MAHAGLEERSTGPYFSATRPKPCSQGDVYSDIPYLLPFEAIDAPATIVSRDVMILTRSCDIDYGNGHVLVAPVEPMTAVIERDEDAIWIRRYDCFHGLMYLPAHDKYPERIVNLEAGQLVRLDVVRKCDTQIRLTYAATQQLQRKLTLYWTGLHIPRDQFVPPADDF